MWLRIAGPNRLAITASDAVIVGESIRSWSREDNRKGYKPGERQTRDGEEKSTGAQRTGAKKHAEERGTGTGAESTGAETHGEKTSLAMRSRSRPSCGPRTMLRYEAGLLSLGTLRPQRLVEMRMGMRTMEGREVKKW